MGGVHLGEGSHILMAWLSVDNQDGRLYIK